jgi:Cu(I)/Ag(I) efflux system membrane protein CusA/SilA
MPTTMPHASIGEATEILKQLDRRIMSVPEVEIAVGKIGRVESPLDPAPVSMVETVIEYKSEYRTDEKGRRLTFRIDSATGEFVRDEQGELIPDDDGRPYRQWREQIESPQDIWDAIVAAADMPGVTSAPMLQPIETRIVMLQSGFRAPMGIKVYGPDLETIEAFGLKLERLLKEVPSVQPAAVFADRVVGKPYIEIDIDRERIARYGLQVADVQEIIEVAIGGKPLTMTVEGRERYPVRVRYLRELRDQPETLGDILVPTPGGAQIPLRELADIEYRRGPQMIKSEDTFLVAYVLFDKQPGYAEVTVVNDARDYIQSKIVAGDLVVPAGVSYEFAGSYKNQVRAAKRLTIVLPLSLAIIFLLLYFQFRRVSLTLMVFSGVFVAWGGGFLMLWLYAQPWFLDTHLLGANLRELFQVRPFNLSVAVWVGFLALFGIATDDGVIMATRIKQSLEEEKPNTIDAIRRAVVDGGRLRIRAAVMTSATTILALLPVLTSTGRGSDIMVPMAIPTFGGMAVASVTWFVVPVLYCAAAEWKHRFVRSSNHNPDTDSTGESS